MRRQDINKLRVWIKQNKAGLVFILLMIIVALLYVAMFYTGFNLGQLIMALLLSCPAICLSLQSSEVRKTFRKSLDILCYGLSKPFPYFMVVSLIGLGLLFIAEEITKRDDRSILDYTITMLEKPITLRDLAMFMLSLTSSIIAIRLTSRTSKHYQKFLKYTSRLGVHGLYPIVVAMLGLIYIGLVDTDLRSLNILGFTLLIHWLYIWSFLSVEVRFSSRKKHLNSADA